MNHPSRRSPLVCFRAGCPDGCEEDADDGQVVVDHEDEHAALEVVVTEDEDELDDVEEHREDEVGDGEPEERLQALKV